MNNLILSAIIKINNLAEGMKESVREQLADETGAVSVEYGLLIALVVAGVVGAATVMFDPMKDFFEKVMDTILGMI